jgi:hypothetical protein
MTDKQLPADTVRPSRLYRGCLYCPRCDAHYTPGMEWGIPYPNEHNDTSGRTEWMTQPRRLGNECPFCGARFDGSVSEKEKLNG